MKLLIWNGKTGKPVDQNEIKITFKCVDKDKGVFTPETPFIFAIENNILVSQLGEAARFNRITVCDPNIDDEKNPYSHNFNPNEKESDNGEAA